MKKTKKDIAPNIKLMMYQTIKKRIINLELKPGDILSDRKLAEELAVSRTPVREALSLLQKENYVRQNSRRGFSVSEISLKNIIDMYGVRRALEVAALRQSAINHVASDIKRIDELLKRHKEIIKNFEPEGKFLEDAEFHKSLIKMSKNEYMLEIVESIFERIQMLRNIEGVSKKRVKIAFDQHFHIFQSFKKGLYSEAEQMLHRHIEEAEDDMITRIRSRFEIFYFPRNALR